MSFKATELLSWKGTGDHLIPTHLQILRKNKSFPSPKVMWLGKLPNTLITPLSMDGILVPFLQSSESKSFYVFLTG